MYKQWFTTRSNHLLLILYMKISILGIQGYLKIVYIADTKELYQKLQNLMKLHSLQRYLQKQSFRKKCSK